MSTREEKLLQKIQAKKIKQAEELRKSEEFRSKLSTINISTGDSDEEKGEGSVAYNGFLKVFTADHYPYPDIPEKRVIKKMTYTDGTTEPIYVIPEVTSPWVCNYYHTPSYKARLAISMAITILAMLAAILSLSLTQTPSVIAAIFLLLALIANIAFRYLGIALWKWPMPRIPFFSDIRIDRTGIEDDEEEEYDSYEEAIEASVDNTDLVRRVENVNNGHMSPATLLTRWMNGPARMTESDLIEASGGALDSFRIRMMMKDDEEVWTDTETIDVLSKITNSRPQQWRDAWNNWNNG